MQPPNPQMMFMPQAMPQQAPPVQSPVGTSSTNKQQQAPSFLSSAASMPPQGQGQKTLLGQ